MAWVLDYMILGVVKFYSSLPKCGNWHGLDLADNDVRKALPDGQDRADQDRLQQ